MQLQYPTVSPTRTETISNTLRSFLPSHVDANGHKFFFVNHLLSLLPPLTRAQCLASKLTDIAELAAFVDKVHCQATIETVLAFNPEPDVNMACATAIPST